MINKNMYCNFHVFTGFPVLNNAPTLLNVSKNNIGLSFNEWSNSSDSGNGVPVLYKVLYKVKLIEISI